MFNISQERTNFLLANLILIVFAVLFLLFKTWKEATVLGGFKIILDFGLIFALDKGAKEAILGIKWGNKFNFGWNIKRK